MPTARVECIPEENCGDGTHVIERLVVYARTKHGDLHASACFPQLLSLPRQRLRLRTASKIHLVHQEEDGRIRTVLLQCCQASLVVVQVFLHIARLDFEDVYHDADVLEDRSLLYRQVGIHERVLTATVPEVQNEVTKEAKVVLFDVYRCTKTRREGGGLVRAVRVQHLEAEDRRGYSQDEGTHRRLPTARRAHEENLEISVVELFGRENRLSCLLLHLDFALRELQGRREAGGETERLEMRSSEASTMVPAATDRAEQRGADKRVIEQAGGSRRRLLQ